MHLSVMTEVDAKLFEEKVGRPPVNDDLHRANCNQAGNPGHHTCGWCIEHDKPRFECGCHLARVPATPTRKVFYVDVGEIPADEVKEYIEAVKKKCQKNKKES